MTSIVSMPDAEAAHLLEAYRQARVILEYGSGGSTRVASQMPGKYVLSVESDRKWARNLRREIAAAQPKSPVTVHYVDIGTTAAWGRVTDDSHWRDFHRYSNGIWDEPFFRHPDVVLIDGRFRVACLMTAMLRTQRPLRVLFDDYADREKYHRAEMVTRPRRMIGRMAEFHITPGMIRPQDMGFVIGSFFDVTLHGKGVGMSYGLSPAEWAELQRKSQERAEGQHEASAE